MNFLLLMWTARSGPSFFDHLKWVWFVGSKPVGQKCKNNKAENHKAEITMRPKLMYIAY